ncbi:MAG: DUF1800 domain-containing protein [Longimicrobiales bacterium]
MNRRTALALRALNRFGLGARPGQARGLADPRGWLVEQLDPSSAALEPTTDVAPMADRAEVLERQRRARRAKDEEALAESRRELRQFVTTDVQRTITRRTTTETPYLERLVAFWSNHLCISRFKPLVGPLAGPYENDAIRPHVLGRFEDMVLASARHPAMLLYLDNAQSVGPGSIAATRGRQDRARRGLNENYARELLELHTLGVGGGYTQEDVKELAHILTGWSVSGLGPFAREGGEIAFAFRQPIHDPNERSVLGRSFSQAGVEQGEAAIRTLCRHPATARFLSSKLVRHFVADDPPPEAVARIATVFLDTQGDLAEVARSLAQLEEAWAPDERKFRTPQDWLIAALRALEVDEPPVGVTQRLTPLRQPLWGPPSPKGFGDTLREWADPDGLMNRAEFAQSIAKRFRRNTEDPGALAEVVEYDPGGALTTTLSDAQVQKHDRVALALAGPAFQWR